MGDDRKAASYELDKLEFHFRQFIDDGYTVVKQAFDCDEVGRLLDALERIVQKVRANPEQFASTRYTSRSPGLIDTWGVNSIFAPEFYEPTIASIFGNDRFMALNYRILGPRLRFWSAHALWSPQYIDYELNWHKDNLENEYFDPNGVPRHVQFNVCLTRDNSFRTVPGSHRRPLTDTERVAIDSKDIGSLPGEVAVSCEPGDVIYMTYHMVHRGSCSTTRLRRALQMKVQRFDEPTGGGTSFGYMREPGYLESIDPALAELMRRSIEWDDTNPMSRSEAVRRMRIKREIRKYLAAPTSESAPQE